jgi:hypothetical protein
MLIGCGQSAAIPSPSVIGHSDVHQLRITNASEFVFDRVVVLFPDEQITFKSVALGATTAYQPVPNGVYSYAAYEMTFNGRTIKQGASDWLGEKSMSGEAFTYILSIDPQQPEFAMIQHGVHQD